jgi:hypothetical protein
MIARILVVVALLAGCTSNAVQADSSSSPTLVHPRNLTTSSSPASVSSTPATSGALAALDALPVKGRAPFTGYSREQFGQAWTDDNNDALGHNGCDTRNDILKRDLTDIVFRAGSHCVVSTGVLHDPYTGKIIDFVRGVSTSAKVQIDHVVALGDAWQKGAQQLTPAQRIDLANDPLELLAVDGPTNEAKGDGDAATWLPPNKAFRCDYVARQIAVSAKYDFWVTSAERDAMARVLQACPGESLPQE